MQDPEVSLVMQVNYCQNGIVQLTISKKKQNLEIFDNKTVLQEKKMRKSDECTYYSQKEQQMNVK